MSYHNRTSPKIIPRVKLSPKIKQISNSPKKTPKKISRKITKTPKKIGLRKSPRKITSPYQKSRSKVFLENKEKFRKTPSINPITNRQIKKDGETYKKLVKLYGKPY